MSTVVYQKVAGTPDNTEEVLKASNTAITTQEGGTNNVLDGSGTDSADATYTLPAGTMGPNDAIQITHMWSKTGTAGTFNAKIRFSASLEVYAKTGAGATNISGQTVTIIRANNSTSAQKFFGKSINFDTPNTTTAVGTGSIDTTSDVDIQFVAWCGDTGDTMALEGYEIKLIRAK